MQTYTRRLGGSPVEIFFPESLREMTGFETFLNAGDKVLGLDTETTGLNIYSRDWRCRLVQIGNEREAWVLQADRFREWILRALRGRRFFTVHNAAFDLQVLDRAFGVPIEDLGPRTFDTRILAHLLDPRQRYEGGTGLGLKELSEIYVDPEAPDTAKGLHAVFRKDYKATKATGWSVIDIDHPVYVEYAGLDPVLARRLFTELAPLVRDLGLNHLSTFEHHLQTLLAIMQRRGLRVDVPYTERLREELAREAEDSRRAASRYGVENVNSTKQIAEALVGMGEDLTETTPSGALKVDKGVLLPLADLDLGWERIGARDPNPLADAVVRAKRAEKWNESYVGAFLGLRDGDDRLHPTIGGLQARTARMSISTPPLQQLPSKEWRIRRAIVADPGNVYASIDYQAVEMRVLAALADVTAMKDAIVAGEDLHGFTARLVYGDDYTKAQRGLMKGVGFGKVYGGGAATLARQTGAPMEAVRAAIAEYDRVYPEVKRFSRRLQERANYGKKEVVTPAGRHLPLDRDRLYAGTNYVVQSTARDLLAQAIVDVFDAGLGGFLRLPIHDELLLEVPEGPDGEAVVADVARLMESTFQGVPIESDAEVGGRSWGSLYGADE